MVFALNEEISSQIDCTECGNCCRTLRPPMRPQEIKKFCRELNILPGEFLNHYTETLPNEKFPFLKGMPCPFLENNRCLHYAIRPRVCAGYPFLDRKEFAFRLINVIRNYSICPIVYNVFERLKVQTGYKKKSET